MKTYWALCMLCIIAGLGQQSTAQTVSSPDSTKKMIGHIEQLDPGLTQLLDTTAQLEVIGEGFTWSEGPVWVEEHQFLLFSDIPNNVIHKWKEGKGVTEYLKPAGYTDTEARGGEKGSNGLIIGNDGSLLLCQHGDRRIARMDAPLASPAANFITLADSFNNKKLNTPNDLVQHSNGGHILYRSAVWI